jgi:hypothetical protein
MNNNKNKFLIQKHKLAILYIKYSNNKIKKESLITFYNN